MRPTRRFGLALVPLFALLLVVPWAFAESGTALHGLAPWPDGRRVPPAFLPPGAPDPDTGPSDAIYPEQHVTIRFNHAEHLGPRVGATCKTCHAGAYRSPVVSDRLTPTGEMCDACHSTDHSDTTRVKAGTRPMGQCAFCHLGYDAGDGNRVAELDLPRAHLVFDHKAHVDRNIACPQCHGAVERLELATRDQLPRMKGCLRCHQAPDAASRGDAKAECATCHVRARDRPAGIQTPSTRPTSSNGTGRSRPTTPSSARTATPRTSARTATTGAPDPAASIPATTSRCTRSRRGWERSDARAATRSKAFASTATSAWVWPSRAPRRPWTAGASTRPRASGAIRPSDRAIMGSKQSATWTLA